MLYYLEFGDKYQLTLKDVSTRQFLCKKQDVPRDFAIYQVPVDELDDPGDVLRILKDRIAFQIRTDASSIKQVSADQINKSFFMIRRTTMRPGAPFRGAMANQGASQILGASPSAMQKGKSPMM